MSLKKEIMNSLKKYSVDDCTFTSADLCASLDLDKVKYSKKSLSAMLSTLVKQGWLQKYGKEPVNKGRALQIYFWNGTRFPLSQIRPASPEPIKTPVPDKAPTTSVSPIKSDELSVSQIGRAVVENIFEMRKLLAQQAETIGVLTKDLHEVQHALSRANIEITKRNQQIQTLEGDLATLRIRERKQRTEHCGSFKLSELATIKG